MQISLFCAIPLLLIDEAESLIVESSLSDSDEQNRNQQTIRICECFRLTALSFAVSPYIDQADIEASLLLHRRREIEREDGRREDRTKKRCFAKIASINELLQGYLTARMSAINE